MTNASVRRILSMVVSLSLLGGCGGNTGDSTPTTKDQYCDVTGEAYCARAVECSAAEHDSCVQDFKRSCCETDESCALPAKDAGRVKDLQDRCVQALSTQACEDITAGAVPGACTSEP